MLRRCGDHCWITFFFSSRWQMGTPTSGQSMSARPRNRITDFGDSFPYFAPLLQIHSSSIVPATRH
jgi:hypothetical protein